MGTHFPFMEAPSFILVNNIIVTSRFEMVTSEFMVISTFMLTTSLMVTNISIRIAKLPLHCI